MEKKYWINGEQFRLINHYQRMFELHAERINELCSSEKDDIVYGFQLGEIHNHLRQCFSEMMELESEIRQQEIKEL